VAGRTREAAAAQSEQVIEAVIADDLHHAVARATLNRALGSRPIGHD